VDIKFRIADKNILASVLFESTRDFLRDYLCDFDLPDLTVEVLPEDILTERIKSDAEAELEGTPIINYSDKYLETLALYRKIAERIIDFGIILFHGSTLSVDGEAFLFTAKSGTGKSTHTRLWREKFGDRVRMVNDDKPLIAISEEIAIDKSVDYLTSKGVHMINRSVSYVLPLIAEEIERGGEWINLKNGYLNMLRSRLTLK